jgi:hypothetical protein
MTTGHWPARRGRENEKIYYFELHTTKAAMFKAEEEIVWQF